MKPARGKLSHWRKRTATLGPAVLNLGWRLLSTRRPAPHPLERRLAAFPTNALPVQRPVSIRWNKHQVPFVETESDRDLAVALGGVHAHLRLAQLEIMRHLSQGRVSEVVGPAGVELDQTLRLLDVGRAVPAIEARLPPETAEWLEAFVSGLNAYVRHLDRLPYEMRTLGLDPKPWTSADLLRLSRLASTDFTWKVWLRLLRLRRRTDWAELWEKFAEDEEMPVPSFAGGSGGIADTVDQLLGAFDRGGSNSVAVAGRRTASGAAMIASDPHLAIMLPNLWLIAGCRSPSYNLVGLMVPGVPAFALGRNRRIAWGGTSLHAASSDLVDLQDLPESEITIRHERIRVRWSADRDLQLRDTRFGPVISDAAALDIAGGHPFALRWIGHDPTDELSALLGVNRAHSWKEFRHALEGFAIPAQNMIFADSDGRVGQLMAARLPKRPHAALTDIVAPREVIAHWDEIVTLSELPQQFDPPEGFVASSNNAPRPGKVRVGFFFSPDDRVQRARDLLSGDKPIGRENLVALQTDVEMPRALPLRDAMLGLLEEGGAETPTVIDALARWEGRYDSKSRGALAFELMVYRLVEALHGPERLGVYQATWDPWAMLRKDLAATERKVLASAAANAARSVEKTMLEIPTWGDAHRLQLAHGFSALPVVGRRFRFTDEPWAGSNETLMKAAYGLAGERHRIRMGANARHISDLADLDTNWFVLLGGQDGWLGSTTFHDQFGLWRDKRMIWMPLRAENVRKQFPHAITLSAPGGSAE